MSEKRVRQDFVDYLQILTFLHSVDLKQWESFKIGSFHINITIRFPSSESFWLGIGLNQTKTHWGRVRLDFNPNKLGGFRCFREILAYLNSHCRPMHTRISRFDLAVDFPVLRSNVFMLKDARAYRSYLHGREHTEYLGPKSHPSHVKLYNKQAEAHLSFPLTRLELTLDPDVPYVEIKWPVVYYLRDMQMSFDDMALNETERFILHSLLEGCGSLTQLGRKTRAKMERIMQNYVDAVEVSKTDYRAICEQLGGFLRYPLQPLDTKADAVTCIDVLRHIERARDMGNSFTEIAGDIEMLPFTVGVDSRKEKR